MYALSLWGIFVLRKEIIITLLSIELMFLAANLNFLLFALALGDSIGQIFFVVILSVAGAEAVIGLAFVILVFRVRGLLSVQFLNLLKG